MTSGYRVVTPYLVAGIEVSDGRITRTAPILKGWRGKPLIALEHWIARKGRGFSVSILKPGGIDGAGKE